MIKIIVNADDCGANDCVNQHIRNAIIAEKITSTTVMANMPGLDGAIKLYKDFSNQVSFGVHLNLTEGIPLVYNQELLDKGLYKEKNDSIVFNCNPYRNRLFSFSVMNGLKKELETQIERLLDNGLNPSHIDSHHHIHTAPSFWAIVPYLAKKYKINRFRRMRNLLNGGGTDIRREIWTWGVKMQNRELRTTRYFTSMEEYLPMLEKRVRGDYSVELMCHPGGDRQELEDRYLKCIYDSQYFELMSYYNL